jgi:hypothetical protein
VTLLVPSLCLVPNTIEFVIIGGRPSFSSGNDKLVSAILHKRLYYNFKVLLTKFASLKDLTRVGIDLKLYLSEKSVKENKFKTSR